MPDFGGFGGDMLGGGIPGYGGGMFGADPFKKKKKKQGFDPMMMLSPMMGLMMSNPKMGLTAMSPGIGIANMLGAFK